MSLNSPSVDQVLDTPDVPAASSPATDAQPVSLSSALFAAMGGATEVASSPTTTDPAPSEGAAPESETPPAEGTAEAEASGTDEVEPEGEEKAPEDEKPLPFHEHPRWKQIVQRNKELEGFRTEAEDLRTRVTEYEHKATQFENVVRYCEENQISDQEFNRLLEFGRLAKVDPAAALEVISGIQEKLSVVTGRKLDPDLEADLRDDLITEERAKEMMALRAKIADEQSRRRKEAEELGVQRQTAEQARLNGIMSAIGEHERRLQLDPSYKAVAPVLAERFELWVRKQGKSVSADTATKALSKIFDEEKARFAKLAPKPQPVSKPIGTRGPVTGVRQPVSGDPWLNKLVAAMG